jgi:AcrR family transcriptional regulator
VTQSVNRWVVTDPRRQQILDAAFDVFMRYGYRRSTMDDIAQQVGLSRPTLYLTFPSREAVFRAVVEAGHNRLLDDAEAALLATGSLADRLERAFEIWSVQPFDLVTRSPAAEELMTDTFGFASDLFVCGAERMITLLADTIGAAARPDALQPSARARARVLVGAVHGFKSTARDTEDMRQLVRDLVAMTVAGLPQHTPR